jgi:hypothetical protein
LSGEPVEIAGRIKSQIKKQAEFPDEISVKHGLYLQAGFLY